MFCEVDIKVKVLPYRDIDATGTPPRVTAEEEAPLMSIHLRSVEGIDPNHEHS